jgi:hypothetical protein
MSRLLALPVLALALAPACTPPDGGGAGDGASDGAGAMTPVAETGTLQIPLRTTAPNGDAYRLVGAAFDVTGPAFSEVIVDVPDDLVISRTLPVGAYDVALQGRYHLEKNVEGTWSTVPAVLVSPNPQTGLAVASEQTTQAVFRFRTREGLVEFAPGDLDIVIEVEPAGSLCGPGAACLSGGFTLDLDLPAVGEVPSTGAFAHLVGVPVTFAVSFDLTPFQPEPFPMFGRCTRASTENAQVAFAGDPTGFLQNTLGPQLAGAVTQLEFCAEGETVRFRGGNFADAPNEWGFEISDSNAGVEAVLDAAGFPVPASFAAPGAVILRKYAPFSDFASGPGTLTVFLP